MGTAYRELVERRQEEGGRQEKVFGRKADDFPIKFIHNHLETLITLYLEPFISDPPAT